jgi:hypothetical protein
MTSVIEVTGVTPPIKNPNKKSLIKPIRWLSPVLPDKIERRVSPRIRSHPTALIQVQYSIKANTHHFS